MKHYLFIYLQNRTFAPYEAFASYDNREIHVERSFPSKVTDEEIAAEALKLAWENHIEDDGAGSNTSSRRLVKILSIARELTIHAD